MYVFSDADGSLHRKKNENFSIYNLLLLLRVLKKQFDLLMKFKRHNLKAIVPSNLSRCYKVNLNTFKRILNKKA